MASTALQKSLQQHPPLNLTLSTSNSSQLQQQQQQHHVKLQQQNSLPLQLLSYNKQLQQHAVTTTQPSAAGTFKSRQQTASLRNSSITSSLMLNGLDLDSGNASVAGAIGGGNGAGDISPISSTASFSSADTNQTLLNVIMASHQLQQQQNQLPTQQQSLPATPVNSNFSRGLNNNRSFRTKYSQFMIITPAVSIDRDFLYETSLGETSNQKDIAKTTTRKKLNASNGGNAGVGSSAARRTTNKTIPTITTTNTCTTDKTAVLTETTTTTTTTRTSTTGTINKNSNNMDHIDIDDMSSYFNNGNNNFRMSLLQGSIDSGCSSDSGSFRSNYNPYLHTSRQHLLPKSTPQNFYTFSSWRWCTLICAAMRCFGAGGHSSHASYSTSFVRPPYQRTRSHGYEANSTSRPRTTPHKRLRPSSSFTAETAFEHFSAPFTNTTSTPRKTRDHMNNITYEL